jgi:hypothetical protein
MTGNHSHRIHLPERDIQPFFVWVIDYVLVRSTAFFLPQKGPRYAKKPDCIHFPRFLRVFPAN